MQTILALKRNKQETSEFNSIINIVCAIRWEMGKLYLFI